MEIIAKSKYIRTSARKLRLMAEAIGKLAPKEALVVLEQVGKRTALPLGKTLKSALANAAANFGLTEENLKIKKIEISQGPVYKRLRAVSRGRAHPIAKRTSHITVVLEGEKITKKER